MLLVTVSKSINNLSCPTNHRAVLLLFSEMPKDAYLTFNSFSLQGTFLVHPVTYTEVMEKPDALSALRGVEVADVALSV